VWHDLFVCVTWLIHMWDMTHSYVWRDSFICVTRLIHMCDATHSYVWHDSFICVTWLIQMCDMTHSYVWHDSFIYVTWLIHMHDTTHQIWWHDLYICRHLFKTPSREVLMDAGYKFDKFLKTDECIFKFVISNEYVCIGREYFWLLFSILYLIYENTFGFSLQFFI